MAIKKICRLFSILIILVPCKSVYSQLDSNFVIFDFNNVKQVLNIKEAWSKDQCILSIKSIKPDTLKVNGVAEIINKQILFRKFLQIEFRIRGGSGIHLRVTKLFSIKNDKIYQTLSLLTTYEYTSINKNDNENYSVKFTLFHDNIAYKIGLIESAGNLDRIKKKWSKQFALFFDSQNMVFYNKKISESKVKLCNSMLDKTGLYAIELKSEKYINLNNTWYRMRQDCYELF